MSSDRDEDHLWKAKHRPAAWWAPATWRDYTIAAALGGIAMAGVLGSMLLRFAP